jgi:hypothetical protein
MKYNQILLLAATVAGLLIGASIAWADDLQITGTVKGDQTYDSPEGIVFDAAVLDKTANVVATSTFEVYLKPGTTIQKGARLVITVRDNDGLSNAWELNQCNTLKYGPGDDPDVDGLTMLEEYQKGTLACNSDSDGDGMPDGWEVDNNLDPLVDDANQDPDGDALTNLQEYQAGTDPHNPDSDGDGMPDGWEVQNGLDPLSDDANGDLDGDGYTNGEEYTLGTAANDANSKPPHYDFQYDANGNLIQVVEH